MNTSCRNSRSFPDAPVADGFVLTYGSTAHLYDLTAPPV